MVDRHNMDVEMSEEYEMPLQRKPTTKLSAGRRNGVLLPDATLESFMVKKTILQIDLQRKHSTQASSNGDESDASPLDTESDFSDCEEKLTQVE